MRTTISELDWNTGKTVRTLKAADVAAMPATLGRGESVALRMYGFAVVHLGEGPGEPNWEAFAPDGYHFFPEYTHTLLGTTQQDLRDRLRGNNIERCSERCGGLPKKTGTPYYCSCENDPAATMVNGVATCAACSRPLAPETLGGIEEVTS